MISKSFTLRITKNKKKIRIENIGILNIKYYHIFIPPPQVNPSLIAGVHTLIRLFLFACNHNPSQYFPNLFVVMQSVCKFLSAPLSDGNVEEVAFGSLRPSFIQ